MDDDPNSWKAHKPKKLIRTTRVSPQKAAGLLPGEKVYRKEFDPNRSRASSHDVLADALDLKENVHRISDILEKIAQGKGDVSTYFPKLSPLMTTELIKIALTGIGEKNRLDAIKHLLALGGHNPTQKHEVARIDPNTPTEAIKSLIRGASEDLKKQGIVVTDE